VDVRELPIADAFEITPGQHRDERGVFLEWYRFEPLMERHPGDTRHHHT
jgi:dTDP-4-dehydrorhamnose 3,5-epimerase